MSKFFNFQGVLLVFAENLKHFFENPNFIWISVKKILENISKYWLFLAKFRQNVAIFGAKLCGVKIGYFWQIRWRDFEISSGNTANEK